MRFILVSTLAFALAGTDLFLSLAYAEQSIQYRAEARVDGHPAYYEKQTALLTDNGKILSSDTRYESIDGKLIAEMKSDFKDSLTTPNHWVHDFRSGSELGLRREGAKLVLFHHEANKPEETRVLTDKDAGDRIMIAGQGLSAYLHENLDKIAKDQVIPLRLLIPGKLDYYDFDLTQTNIKEGVVEFEISAKNWFFRLLAPKIKARYDIKTRRILWYDGISNISNDKGDSQNVTMDFTYSP